MLRILKKLQVLVIPPKGENKRHRVHLMHVPRILTHQQRLQLDLSKQLKRFRHPASTRIDGIWEPNFDFENSSLHISLLLVPLSAKGKLRVGLAEGFQIHHNVSLFFFIYFLIYIKSITIIIIIIIQPPMGREEQELFKISFSFKHQSPSSQITIPLSQEGA